QKSVDIGERGVRERFGRVRRHLAGGLADVLREPGERERTRAEPRAGRRGALRLVAVALVAAVAREQLPPILRIPCRRGRLTERSRSNREERQTQRDSALPH